MKKEITMTIFNMTASLCSDTSAIDFEAEFEITESEDDLSHPDDPCSRTQKTYTAELQAFKAGDFEITREHFISIFNRNDIEGIEGKAATEYAEGAE